VILAKLTIPTYIPEKHVRPLMPSRGSTKLLFSPTYYNHIASLKTRVFTYFPILETKGWFYLLQEDIIEDSIHSIFNLPLSHIVTTLYTTSFADSWKFPWKSDKYCTKQVYLFITSQPASPYSDGSWNSFVFLDKNPSSGRWLMKILKTSWQGKKCMFRIQLCPTWWCQ
jgi:hypothetical protein